MDTDTEQLNSFLSLILIGVLLVAIILLLLPQLGNFGRNEADSIDDPQGDNALQPMRKIFLQYNHSSVNDWLAWVRGQEVSFRDAAFANLAAYLENPPGEIGSLVTEVIKAVVALNYPESFTCIHHLIENVRKQLSSYHTADQFYAQAVQGLVELNERKAQSILMSEFDLMKNKHESEQFMMAIANTISTLSTNDELNDFWSEVLTDPLYSLAIKEHIIQLLTKQKIDPRISVAVNFFQFWTKSKIKKIPDNDIKIIKAVFHSNQDLIVNEDYELWDIVLKACDQALTETVFVELISEVLASVDVAEDLLLQLFDAEHTIRKEFLEALAKKNSLSSYELELIKTEHVIHMGNSASITELKKYKTHKQVPQPLEDVYHYLIRALSLDQEFKNNHLPVLNLLLGQSLSDKQYLVECLAANYGYNVININLPGFLDSVTEFVKLKPLIHHSKPCIVYFHGLDDLINRNLNDIETSNLELLNILLKESRTTAGLNFLASLEISQENFTHNDNLQELLKEMFTVSYGLTKNIDKPDIVIRQKLLNDYTQRINPSRMNSSAGLELIAKETEDYSSVEFLAYLNSYMRFCLLVYGELKSPADLYQAFMDKESSHPDQEGELLFRDN